jgi:cyclic-di-AMP phosphodiesterase PgpH
MTEPSSSLSSSRAPSEPGERRATMGALIPRRPAVSLAVAVALAIGFGAVVTAAITADAWLLRFGVHRVVAGQDAPFTVRVPMLAGVDRLRIGGGGVVVARGEPATAAQASIADALADAAPGGPLLYLAVLALTCVLAAAFVHLMRRSIMGRLVRVQVVSLVAVAVLAVAVKILVLSTAISVLVVPVAVLALVPTMVLDRIVGIATGVLGALIVSLLTPFDLGLAILLLVQAATAGLVVAEQPKRRWLAALAAGGVTTLCTSASYLLMTYLITGRAPELADPLHSAWFAAAIGPALAALLAVPLIPPYQRLVGEITQNQLVGLEDLGHPLLRQIAQRSPGTWQHSLMMANMAEIAADAIGANGRLVRVGAYFHDLGKSLQPKYFIENLEPGETSPHDQLPPEASCDAIFAHVSDGIVAARQAGLHERIIDFMHMHHGSGVLEYFWARCREQGNPRGLTSEDFRYPGYPPQSRETAILMICDAVEAAARTLKRPDAAAIDGLVQRIVYGKLHLGQLDDSGLAMRDLRRISDSLRETIRHANHGRIEYPWQRAGQDASASPAAPDTASGTSARLDSLDRRPARDPGSRPPTASTRDAPQSDVALAATADQSSSAASAAEPSRASAMPGVGTAPTPPAEPEAPGPGHAHRDPRMHPDTAPRGSGTETVRLLGQDGVRGSPAPASANDPARTLPGRAPGPQSLRAPSAAERELAVPDRQARKRAATLPPAEPRRPPTPPPAIARTASELSRTAGPPAAVDLDNAVTNPPPLRRGPSGHPPVPGDPAQLAAALAATVTRPTPPPGAVLGPPGALSAARPGVDPTPRERASGPPGLRSGEPEDEIIAPPATLPARLPVPAAAELETTPAPSPIRPTASAEAFAGAVTRPSLAAPASHAPRSPASLDAAATTPVGLRAAPSPAPARPAPTSIDSAVTQPSLPAVRLATRSPPTSGLADHDPPAPATLRDPGVDPVTIRPRRQSADPPAQVGEAAAGRGLDSLDAGVTEPSLPVLAVGDQRRIDVSLRPAAAASASVPVWTAGLAARIDAALGTDPWSPETPVVAPSNAALRALLGNPDPTRPQPIDEIELLARRAAALGESDPRRRSPHPTAEVDPDDIEAAIELAPPARRPATANTIAATRPKKAE